VIRTATLALVLVLTASACAGTDDTGPSAADPSTDATGATVTATAGDDADASGVAPTGDGIVCWAADPAAGATGIAFVDATAEFGLIEPLTGMRAHAAAFGDIDGDTVADLLVGTFAIARPDIYLERGATEASPDRLLTGSGSAFEVAAGFPETRGRTSGAVMVDLDGDGDDDIVLSRNFQGREAGEAVTAVLENDAGVFRTVDDAGLDPTMGGRSIGVLDVDGDGLLDLLVVEDRYRGGTSRLFRNTGGLVFEDVTGTMFPAGIDGLGVATGDLDGDGLTDLFVAGSNRLFENTGSGLSEVPGAVPIWETFGNEDDVAGAAIADVNRDGMLDLVVGHHFNSTLSRGVTVPVRLYLNRTASPGAPIELEDVTDAAGLIGIPTKAPHVELADVDNDGWPDIVTSASAADGTEPAVFRHTGLEDGIPRFEAPDGLGSAQYWVSAPTADLDRDGRLDVLAIEWEPALPSVLFRNDSAAGGWIEVSVGPELGGGVGTRVDVYPAGAAGDQTQLLGSREIVATVGYTAGVERIAHFGLGDVEEVDVVVGPPGADPLTVTATANTHIRLPDGCG
jgi:hypothetical protein